LVFSGRFAAENVKTVSGPKLPSIVIFGAENENVNEFRSVSITNVYKCDVIITSLAAMNI